MKEKLFKKQKSFQRLCSILLMLSLISNLLVNIPSVSAYAQESGTQIITQDESDTSATKQTGYTIEFNAGDNGTLTASQDGKSISCGAIAVEGSSVVFTATPNQNYQVKEWTVNGKTVSDNKTNTLTISEIASSNTVTVAFELSEKYIAYPVDRKTLAEALDMATNVLINKFDDNDFNYQKHWMSIAINGFGKAVPSSYLSEISAGDMPAKNSGQYGKYILGILAAGGDPTNINGRNLLEELCQLDDMKNVKEEGGIYSTPFGLLALDAVNYEIPADAGFTRDDLINELITMAKPENDIDGVGFVLTALGKYYNTKPEVKEAVDSVVTAWADRQSEDGGFAGSWSKYENVNTAAQVLMGLCFNGFDPQSEQFTKSKGNLISFILSYQNEDGTFNWQRNNPGSISMATEQAVYALDQYVRQLDGDKSIYDFTSGGIDNPDIVKPVITTDLKDQTVDTSEFSFTATARDSKDSPLVPEVLLGSSTITGTDGIYRVTLSDGPNIITVHAKDSLSNELSQSYTVTYTASNVQAPGGNGISTPQTKEYVTLSVDKLTINKGYSISPEQIELQSGDTAWTLLKRELDKRGISCRYIWTAAYSSVYVQSIDGDGEFDHGSKSGWMYAVNGWYPDYGASKYTLKSGDRLEWRYTTNLGKDLGQDLSQWESTGETAPTVNTPGDTAPTSEKTDIAATAETSTDKLFDLKNIYADADKISTSAYQAVSEATQKGFIEAKDGKFNPKDKITKAEFVKIIVMILGLNTDTAKVIPYTDVKKKDSCYPYINAAYNAGLLEGSSKKFNPDKKITREQMAVIISKGLGLKKASPATEIKDIKKAAAGNQADIKAVLALGLMDDNKGKFTPKGYVTREKAVLFAMKAYACHNKTYQKPSGVTDKIKATAALMQKTVENPVVASMGGEWTVLSLARSGIKVSDSYYDKYYANVESKLKETGGKLHSVKYTEYDRVILALGSIERDVTSVAGYDLTKPLADFNTLIKQGLNGPVWALIALDSRNYPIPADNQVAVQTTRELLVDYILSKELAGGGWSLTSEAPADTDITAMTIQALSKYRTNEKAEKAIERALIYLSSAQQKDGSFHSAWSKESSCESTAQVIVALTSLSIDPRADNRFIKNGRDAINALLDFYTEGGGFRHTRKGEQDAMATDQGMYALVAYDRFVQGKNTLYDMTDVTVKK